MELDEIKQPPIIKFSHRFNLNNSQMSNNDIDSGFESLLNDSSSYNNSPAAKSPRSTFEQKSPLHSSPGSPLKPQTPLILTPIKKQVADLNGIYYSCIKSPLKSPQNYFNTDTFIRERDTHTANLLRSPAFKPQFIDITPVKKIKCKQFKEEQSIVTTPNEEEFLQLLFKNRHLASNPECIIGRCMGLDNCDILNELNKRSMNNVIDKIMNNLDASDYKNIYHVSKQWRDIIQQDKKRNRERIKYIRFKKKFIESAKVIFLFYYSNFFFIFLFLLKENISSPGFIKETLNPNLLKRKFSLISTTCQAFNELDINCLNNDCTVLSTTSACKSELFDSAIEVSQIKK